MRVLLIEDDQNTAQSIQLMLTSESMFVEITDLGEDGIDLGKRYDYDAIILDLSLPDVSGFKVIERLRLAKVPTPILVISSLDGVDERVKALNLGADDCMAKPFHKDEMVARIHALVRRSKGHPSPIITAGEMSVNLVAKTVHVGGERVHLTPSQYRMLELLCLRKGTTVTKEMFFDHLYGGADEPELKIVDVFMCKTRAKLRAAGDVNIETVWGRGYALHDPGQSETSCGFAGTRGIDHTIVPRSSEFKGGRVLHHAAA